MTFFGGKKCTKVTFFGGKKCKKRDNEKNSRVFLKDFH